VQDDAPVVPTTPEAPLREPFLLQLLERFEGGELDAYEYGRRVNALERTTSTQEMTQIVEAPGALAVDAASGVRQGVPTRPALDPVDLARLAAPTTSAKARNPRARYVMLVIVVIAILVALVIGIWLARRVQVPSPSSLGPLPGFVHHASGSIPVPSPRSPRR
jgi:hypothetical protein